MKHLPFTTNSFQTTRCVSCFVVKCQEPFSNAQWTCNLTLILRDKYAWWGTRRIRKHYPVFGALDDSIPCARRVGILVKCASTSFRSNYEPSVIRSLIAKQREDILAKALWRPV